MPDDTSTADLGRRLETLLRPGTVAAIDAAAARCRVRSGGLLTDWLPWFAARAGDVRAWSAPSVGEQVLLLSPGGDLAAAVVLLGLYSDTHAAPSADPQEHTMAFPDGALISYHHGQHALKVLLPAGGTADITAPASVTVHSSSITLDAPQTTCTGQLVVQGMLSYLAGMSGKGSGGGAAAVIQGSVQASGDVTAGAISLQNHRHGGVRAGGDTSSGPQ